ncbi:MAG: hypothetical protein L6R40_004811 [Gallowayella cf. fulva]|nr:MAG: hypothetical protein L6R40_004811 [Xanthomendoza cf. fulva]
MALTPVKGKRALPSSTSILFPELPTSQRDWQVALEHVKSRFLKGQWKECATRCHQLLHEAPDSPDQLRATYLHFYAAICYETIARGMHDLSDAKIPNLVLAGDAFRAAAASLQFRKISTESEGWDDDAIFETPRSPETPWFQSPIKSRIASYQSGSPTLANKFHFRSSRMSVKSAEPSPLHIHKNLQISSFPITPPRSKPPRNQSDLALYPPLTPPSKIRNSTSSFPRLSVTFSASSFTWLHQRSNERYNAHIAEFADKLRGHIAVVEHAITNVKEAQANKFVKGPANFGADKEARAADIRARIVRLRARGWKRQRFAPGKYRELCTKALAEL